MRRQIGKSTALAVVALFEASTRRGITVLIVSLGELASRRLLEDCAALAGASPLLASSVLDESRSSLVLSNGSRILSVLASQRQIRSACLARLVGDRVRRAAELGVARSRCGIG